MSSISTIKNIPIEQAAGRSAFILRTSFAATGSCSCARFCSFPSLDSPSDLPIQLDALKLTVNSAIKNSYTSAPVQRSTSAGVSGKQNYSASYSWRYNQSEWRYRWQSVQVSADPSIGASQYFPWKIPALSEHQSPLFFSSQ